MYYLFVVRQVQWMCFFNCFSGWVLIHRQDGHSNREWYAISSVLCKWYKTSWYWRCAVCSTRYSQCAARSHIYYNCEHFLINCSFTSNVEYQNIIKFCSNVLGFQPIDSLDGSSMKYRFLCVCRKRCLMCLMCWFCAIRAEWTGRTTWPRAVTVKRALNTSIRLHLQTRRRSSKHVVG